MNCQEITYTRHAFTRMFSRSISPEQIRSIVSNGEVIIEYKDDTPFPSILLLGYSNERPIHVLVGRDSSTAKCYVITVYEPDPVIWEDDYKRRRKK
ncbi:MAG: DUF4258 domain-containing protein [Spirochaetia bacterium]